MGTRRANACGTDGREVCGRLRIICVIDHLGPAGAQQQMVTLGTRLKSRGHDVDFFVYYPHIDHFKSKLDAAGITLHTSPKKSKWDFGPVPALKSVLKRARYDISVSFLTTPNVYNVLACRGTATRAVVSERSAFPFERVPISVRIRYETYRWADHIVVNSRHQHARLCSEFAWMAGKSSPITNGVDLVRFKPVDGVRPDNGGDALLAVGSIHAGKNFTGLVEGLHVYKSNFDDPPKVSWVGRDPDTDRDRSAFDEAKAALRRYGLEDRWKWLGVRSDVPDLLADHDAFIHPSLFEGLPNAVCEALAAGRPVLASNVCDHPWLVAEGERGFLFDPLDPDEIAGAIRRFVLLTSAERREMGANARSFAERALGVDVFVDNYEQLFVSII